MLFDASRDKVTRIPLRFPSLIAPMPRQIRKVAALPSFCRWRSWPMIRRRRKLPAPVSPKKEMGIAGKKLNAFGSSIGGLLRGNTGSDLAPPPPPVATQIFNGNAIIAPSGANVNARVEMPYGVSTLMKK